MTRKISIIVLHGIGRQAVDFYKELETGLIRELDALNLSECRISGFRYSDVAQPNQDTYWKSLDKKSIRMDRFREIFLYYLGYAGAYGNRPHDKNGNYRKIHCKLELFLSQELKLLTDNGMLVVLAQSFGAYVFSNFYWDYRKRFIKPRRLKGFSERFKLFITTGCNIPVFVAGIENPEPFPRPNQKFRWINIYDKDDVMGWPLMPLGGGFNQIDFIEDRIVDSGLPLLSHMHYWTNRRSLKMIAGAIAEASARGS